MEISCRKARLVDPIKGIKGEFAMIESIQHVINVGSNAIAVIVGMLLIMEMTYYTDCVGIRQKITNVISIVCTPMYTIGWSPDFLWLRIVFMGLPLIFNFFDIFHLKGKERGYVAANVIETILMILLVAAAIFMQTHHV